jgi:hypothetical protein
MDLLTPPLRVGLSLRLVSVTFSDSTDLARLPSKKAMESLNFMVMCGCLHPSFLTAV